MGKALGKAYVDRLGLRAKRVSLTVMGIVGSVRLEYFFFISSLFFPLIRGQGSRNGSFLVLFLLLQKSYVSSRCMRRGRLRI